MKRTFAAAISSAALLVLVVSAQGTTSGHQSTSGQQQGTTSTMQTTGTSGHAGHVMMTPGEANWGPAPDMLPAGAQLAVINGDPSGTGAFTVRAKFPDGYKIPPHWHPQDEAVTVIDGTLLMGMGEQFSEAATKSLGVGSFALMPKGARHFAMAKGDTTVQIHGIGPLAFNYVNASDDPRNSKK